MRRVVKITASERATQFEILRISWVINLDELKGDGGRQKLENLIERVLFYYWSAKTVVDNDFIH